MARYNELLVGRFNRQVQKLFSIKGPVSLATVSDELMPVHTFFSGCENRYLESWQRFGQAASQAALAAANAGIRLRNPSGSNVVAVIEKVTYANLSAGADQPFMQVGAVTTDLANIFGYTGNARFDPRGQKDPTLILSNGNTVASFGGTKWQGAVPTQQIADVIIQDFQEFPILPGDAVQVVTSVVNIVINVSFFWRERFLEESERT